MARKHNKRANKRSQSVDIKAYAQQLEGVFRKYPARKFNYKQLASQLGYKPEMVKAKLKWHSPTWSVRALLLWWTGTNTN